MPIAIWSARYETGISLIDSQHQALFAAVNRLADSFQAGTSAQQVKESLDFLVKYTDEHFQAEEHYMRELGYPGLAPHQDEHAKLMEQVRNLQARLADGKPVTMDVTIFLSDWLKQHINDSDMGYVDFVKEKNRE
jgi:hemerythrin